MVELKVVMKLRVNHLEKVLLVVEVLGGLDLVSGGVEEKEVAVWNVVIVFC